MLKEVYESLEMEIIRFECEDIISASGDGDDNDVLGPEV